MNTENHCAPVYYNKHRSTGTVVEISDNHSHMMTITFDDGTILPGVYSEMIELPDISVVPATHQCSMVSAVAYMVVTTARDAYKDEHSSRYYTGGEENLI